MNDPHQSPQQQQQQQQPQKGGGVRLSYFGGDRITEIDSYAGNARIARGQFGEVSLAVWDDGEGKPMNDHRLASGGATTSKEECGGSEVEAPRAVSSSSLPQSIRRVVAIKTLYQAMVPARGAFNKYCRDADLCDDDDEISSSSNNVPKPTYYLMREVHGEIAALRVLGRHPNVTQLLAVYGSRDAYSAGSTLSLAFEYCPTDLHLALEWRRRTFRPLLPFAVLRLVALDLFRALEHCHAHGVVHGDVKPGNLLVSSAGCVQLCDFGIAHISSRTMESINENGGDYEGSDENKDLLPPPEPVDSIESQQPRAMCTLHYRPPELLLGGSPHGPSVDVWSAGIVVAELATGRVLFPGRSAIDQLYCVLEGVGTPTEASYPAARELPDYGKLHFAPKAPKPVHELVPRSSECPPLMALLEACIVLDPERRCSASAVLQDSSSWLGGGAVDPKQQDPEARFDARRKLIEELVPRELDEPVLLSCLADAATPVLELATRRRKLLQSAAECASNSIGFSL
jgi:serine/threonine protein kinase